RATGASRSALVCLGCFVKRIAARHPRVAADIAGHGLGSGVCRRPGGRRDGPGPKPISPPARAAFAVGRPDARRIYVAAICSLVGTRPSLGDGPAHALGPPSTGLAKPRDSCEQAGEAADWAPSRRGGNASGGG